MTIDQLVVVVDRNRSTLQEKRWSIVTIDWLVVEEEVGENELINVLPEVFKRVKSIDLTRFEFIKTQFGQ